MEPNLLTSLRLPLPWDEFDLPNPLATRVTVLDTGDPAWGWSGATPDLGIPAGDDTAGVGVPGERVVGPSGVGETAPGWDLDHVVLLVPDLDAAVAAMAATGPVPRLRLAVRGRPTAFFRVGPVLEVIESPVRAPALFGVALVTEEPLETVVLRWRSLGRDVGDPHPALQPGRRIFTVRATEAGLAVMSPERAVG